MLTSPSLLTFGLLCTLASAHYSPGPSGTAVVAQHSGSASTTPLARQHKPHHRPQRYNALSPAANSKGPQGLAKVSASKRLAKRGGSYNGRATFYDASGRGACGGSLSPSDYIVAINGDMYGDSGSVSSWCFETITITYGKKSHTATVVDECPGAHPLPLPLRFAVRELTTGLDVAARRLPIGRTRYEQGAL